MSFFLFINTSEFDFNFPFFHSKYDVAIMCIKRFFLISCHFKMSFFFVFVAAVQSIRLSVSRFVDRVTVCISIISMFCVF